MKLSKRAIGLLLLILLGVLTWSQIVRRAFFDTRDGETELENVAQTAVRRESPALEIEPAIKIEMLPKPKGPGHNWTLTELVSLTEGGLANRDFENGRRTFSAAICILCHRFHGSGGTSGPDLTETIGSLKLEELCEAIVNPNKNVPDGYRFSNVKTTTDKSITGRVEWEASGDITVFTNPYDTGKMVRVPAAEIDKITPLPMSLMPAGLLASLNKEEVLDLLAYLMSNNNPADPVFQK